MSVLSDRLAVAGRSEIMTVLSKALYDSRKTILWLSIGLALYGLFIASFYPTIANQSEEFDDMLQSYPKELLSMFYSGDIEELSMSEPGTYIHTEFALWMTLIMGSMVIAQAFNAFTNAERDNSIDMLLSLPISRRALLIGRVLNTAITILVVLGAGFLVFAAATFIWPEFDPPLGSLALGIIGAFLPLMVVAGFSYMLAVLVPSSKRFAGGLAYLFLMGSYLLHSFSGAIDQLKDTRPLYLFDYFNTGDVIRNGINVADSLVLIGVAVVYFAVAYWAVERKDLGV